MIKNWYLEKLVDLGGYYECPKDSEGKRIGPLVGYAGIYEPGKQFVGEIYVNFAKIETVPEELNYVARHLVGLLIVSFGKDVYKFTMCGAPERGKSLALMMAGFTCSKYIYPEKRILELASVGSREKSDLVFGRHEPEEGSNVVIVEDICNNFSTTGKLINLIRSHGANVVAIACFLNRSLQIEDSYPICNNDIPVIALVRQPIPEYRQDDLYVSSDVEDQKVSWSPKKEWALLKEAMKYGS